MAHLVQQGLRNREVAEKLGISAATVKVHLMKVFLQTGYRNRYGLVATSILQDATEIANMTEGSRDILRRLYVENQVKEQICREMKLSELQFRLLKSSTKARLAEWRNKLRSPPNS